MTECTFSGCKVNQADGAGGSLAIFDTSASVEDCLFESSAGTAVLFQSSDASGSHKFNVSTECGGLDEVVKESYLEVKSVEVCDKCPSCYSNMLVFHASVASCCRLSR